ncbi:MAG: translation initiation factor IF-3 [Holosporales bacterium]|nr:translation initiation factor IF-3 [Holosporales bacterium]
MPMINEHINAHRVRVIGANGEVMGIMPIEDALDVAAEANLDLVVVSEESDPPVCKILDYGKHKYDLQKKKIESRKKQKFIDIKEVQFRPFIGENDLMIKCRAIKKFIEAGDKVKIALRYRGREVTRQESGWEVIKKVQEFCREFAKEDSPPKLEGFTIIMMLSKK